MLRALLLRPAAQCGLLLQTRLHTEAAVELRPLLRRLFLLIHPDLFGDAPSAQAANERSLVQLNAWLDVAENGAAATHGVAQAPFAFEFWLRGASSGARAEPQLRRVAVTLPPPERRVGDDLPPSTVRALSLLFKTVGLPEAAAFLSPAPNTRHTLLSLLPTASEALRQAEHGPRGAEDVLRMARSAMRLRRGIFVSFAPGVWPSPPERARLATALAACLDTTPDGTLSHCAVVFVPGEASPGLDRYTGSVRLGAGGDAASWRSCALAVDAAAAAAARATCAAVRTREAAVAAALCVRCIAAESDPLAASPAYAEFLARIEAATTPLQGAAAAAARRAFGSVSLVVSAPPASFGAGSACGSLLVPMDSTPHQLAAFLRSPPAAAAQAASEAAARREAAAAAACSAARTALRLRHLVRAENVSAASFEAACLRLAAASRQLGRATEGLCFRVVPAAQPTALADGGLWLELPADFVLGSRAP